MNIKALFFLCLFFFSAQFVSAQVINLEPKEPNMNESVQENSSTSVELDNIPDFSNSIKIFFMNNNISQPQSYPIDLRLKLKLDEPIFIKKAFIGDYFKATVKEDLILKTDAFSQLFLPKGSYVRGTIGFLKKPGILVMTGELNINVDQIVIPTGDIIPVNASLDFQKGYSLGNGNLDSAFTQNPVISQKQIRINVNDIGFKLIKNFFIGNLIVLYSEENNYNFFKDQELQVVLKGSLIIDP